MADFADIIRPAAGAKFKILDTPVALPGYCAVCRSGKNDGRKYVDFDFDLDWYGAVYFCSHCLTECVYYLGWLNPDKHKELLEILAGLQEEISLIKEENVRLRDVISALGYINPSVRISGTDDVFSDERDKQESSIGDGNSETSVNPVKADKSKSSGSLNERGSKNLQHSKSGDEKPDGEFVLELE